MQTESCTIDPLKGELQDFLPPPVPPPILTADEMRHLAYQGWLSVHLPAEILDLAVDLFQQSESFFAQSSEAKQKLFPPARGTEFGYYQVPCEKEYVTFRREVHRDLPLEQLAREFWAYASGLLHRILVDIARAGGYPLTIWSHMLEGSAALPAAHADLDNDISLLRAFRYEPEAGAADAHVDIGLLTLCLGRGAGLQVFDVVTQTYVDVHGPVVLVGDYTRALLRNRVRAGWHRVAGNPAGRWSLVFALRPCLRHEIDLSSFGHADGGIVNTREHFMKIKGSKYSVNVSKDSWKEQQARSQRSDSPLATAQTV